MSHKSFFQVTGVVFGVIALLHLARLVWGWQAEIGGWSVPMWLSVVAVVVAGFLSYQGFKLSK